MKLILFGFLVCVLACSVKSETQCIEYNKIRDLVREEIKDFHNPKILRLESMIVTMNDQLNRQDEQIRSQNERIHEQQRRLINQDVRIRMHGGQRSKIGSHIPKFERSHKQSVGGSKIIPWKHTEARDFGNSSSRSFIDIALRQSIKPLSKEKPGDRNKRASLNKRLGLNDNIVAFYGYMKNGEAQPGKHQILVFDVIKTNVGLAFNQHSGMFTAPVTDVYAFLWTVSSGTHSHIFSQLVVNSEPFRGHFNRQR